MKLLTCGFLLVFALVASLCGADKEHIAFIHLVPLKVRSIPLSWNRWSFAPDGRQVAWFEQGTGTPGGKVYCGNITSPRNKKLLMQTDDACSFAWQRSGQTLLICSGKKTTLVQFKSKQSKPSVLNLPVKWNRGCFFRNAPCLLGVRIAADESRTLEILNLSSLQVKRGVALSSDLLSQDTGNFVADDHGNIILPDIGYQVNVLGQVRKSQVRGEGCMISFLILFIEIGYFTALNPIKPRENT